MKTIRDHINAQRAGWEVVEIGAHKFWKVPSEELLTPIKNGAAYALLGPILTEVADDKLAFPGTSKLEGAGPFVSSGISVHTIGYEGEEEHERLIRLDALAGRHREVRDDHVVGDDESPAAAGARLVWRDEPMQRFRARHMVVFNELDWYGECIGVLRAHEWTEFDGSLTQTMQSRLDKHFRQSDDELRRWAADLHGYSKDQRKFYYLEIAASLFAPPLSRLWYAANMMALYYLHEDDLRLGFLWSEYLTKMRFEVFALKHIAVTEQNRENGKKGGQRARAVERYAVLDRLARSQFRDFIIGTDAHRLKMARAMARDYDSKAEEALFTINGKLLSNQWFEEWISQFLLAARGVE